MISFSSLLRPDSETVSATTPDDHLIANHAADLRLALAMRGWVDPTLLLPKHLTASERSRVLDAVAPDVQVALIEHPGQWFMRDEERQRFLSGTPATQIDQAIAVRVEGDEADPVRAALTLRRAPLPSDLSPWSNDVLVALGSTFSWLDPSLRWHKEARRFWADEADLEGLKRRVAATLGRRRRRDDVERMTSTTMQGRRDELDMLVEWATVPKSAGGRLLYLSGIGGAGKSTLFAHLEKRLWAAPGSKPPILVHIDCDMPGFDPTDPVALDLALFPQLAVAQPSRAADLMRRAQILSQATRAADMAYQRGSRPTTGKRGRITKAEATVRVESYVGLESTTTEKLGVRSSVSFGALAELNDSTLVLLFDTAELMLARSAIATSSESVGTTNWLASLTGLMDGHDVRVLMAGRNRPTDREVQSLTQDVRRLPGWQVSKPVTIGDLSESDAIKLLIELGLSDRVAEKAAKALPRTPLILKIAADVYGNPEERARFVAQMDAANIDPTVAKRYLTERIVSHLASPVARPYALAAMGLARVTAPLIENVLLPTPKVEASKRLAGQVYRGLRDAGWLVRSDPADQYLTFHPEVRRLALDLMASDPASATLLNEVRTRARDYYARRRRTGDSTFCAYYDIMLGKDPGRRSMDMTTLGAAVDDLPAQMRTSVGSRKSRLSSPPTAKSVEAWVHFVEGTGRRDGEGDRLVKRGYADAALELYRGRQTRPVGRPPTFVLQALADSGYFHTGEVDVEAIVSEVADELANAPASLPNSLRSRIYWLTRFQLMANPAALTKAHHGLLAKAARRFSGSGPVLLFPSITSVAEAFAPERGPIAPDAWFRIKGTIESETRMFLVHHLFFDRNPSWQPHIDALLTLQPDWPERALTGEARRKVDRWMQELREVVFAPYATRTQADLNRFLRQLRVPISIRLEPRTLQSQATLLLRGLTAEFHRPLRAAMTRHAKRSSKTSASLVALTVEMLGELPLRTSELTEREWERRAVRDISAALGLAIPFIDRARRLPSFCERLTIKAGRSKSGDDLASVARAFLEWDKALSAGVSSDWSRLAPEVSGRA